MRFINPVLLLVLVLLQTSCAVHATKTEVREVTLFKSREDIKFKRSAAQHW